MLSRVAAGRLLVGIGIFGLVASLGGIVLGRQLVGQADIALDRSLTLTGEALQALDSSVDVAEDTLGTVEEGIAQAESTTRALVGTVEEGSEVLAGTAEVTDQRIAGGIAAVEESLPALVEVAGVIDRTLRGLSALPLGLSYDPDEPFDESVQDVQRSLDGVADDLREQAGLIGEVSENLAEVGEGTAAIAADLGTIRTSLAAAAALLGDYQATAASASELVAETRDGLGAQFGRARLMVTLLGLTVAAGQVVPLGLGLMLLRPTGARPLIGDLQPTDGAGRPDPRG